ncbi:zinc-binding alcohol dehydrogenase family protein [Cellulomonas sp. JH27-2]|uniref:quinone oxidoreductase family protein n=1 Tax=Cellulomonas sp. JH27-2 TaxID=2774139 RepID=UPI001784B705|nr:zinc-binding alcohol dehydrogenase family protein [Cellulomonas sp. JH27-2]MBD8058223.1 zinc-binding alcohol dehydrogenase family protein [Cellulomonas sp. JH27-2]
MRAALLSAADAVPAYVEHPEPVATGRHEVVVDVLAAALHHLTRSRATGAHYSSAGTFPRVPGVDAVVRDPSGRLRYVVLDDTDRGTFAERTVIDERRSVVLPDDVDPVEIAAAMNPGMSSWIALRRRIDFVAGQRVLVVGATGAAGSMAVQVAKHLGASRVIAAGRNAERLGQLPALGADETCGLDDLARAADVDVVLDYLWGEPAAAGMVAILTARTDRRAPLTWVQIGSIAGATAPVPSVALRSAKLQIVGSGIGSLGPDEILPELPALAAAVRDGAVALPFREVPLADVATAWVQDSAERVVLVP